MANRVKITKKKAEEFARKLTGSTKGLQQEGTANYSWMIHSGIMRYNFWPLDGRIYCQIDVTPECIGSYFFNFETLEPDFEYTDNRKDKERDKQDRETKLDFLEWLRDSKWKINIPSELISKYKSIY